MVGYQLLLLLPAFQDYYLPLSYFKNIVKFYVLPWRFLECYKIMLLLYSFIQFHFRVNLVLYHLSMLSIEQ